ERSNGIGGRNDCRHQYGQQPGQVNAQMEQNRQEEQGDEQARSGQQKNGQPAFGQPSDIGAPCALEQQCWQEDKQHNIWIKHHSMHERAQTNDQPNDNQHQRIGQAQSPGDQRDNQRDRQENDQRLNILNRSLFAILPDSTAYSQRYPHCFLISFSFSTL